MSQIVTKGLASNAATGPKIRLENNVALRARNAANSADVNIVKVNASDFAELGVGLNAAALRMFNMYLEPVQLASDPTGVTGQVYYNTTSNTLKFYNGTVWASIGGGGGGATTALDNLAAVAINTTLLPDADATHNLGASGFSWATLWLSATIKDASDFVAVDIGTRALNDAAGNEVARWPTTTGGSNSVGFLELAKEVQFNDGFVAANFYLSTANNPVGGTQGIIIEGGTATGGASGDVFIRSGGADTTSSGAVAISTGAPDTNIASGGVSMDSAACTGTGASGTATISTGTTVGAVSGGANFQTGACSGAFASGQVTLQSGSSVGGGTGDVVMNSGNDSGAGATGSVTAATGASTTGNSGNISLTIGTAGGTQGSFIFLKDGVASVVGQVWTASGVGGQGYWANNAAAATWGKVRVSLSAGDITNQYYDLTEVAVNNSVSALVKGQAMGIEDASDEYTLAYTGGVAGKTRINFGTNWATGGGSALVAGDILVVQFQY